MELMSNDYQYDTDIKAVFAFKYYPKLLDNTIKSRGRSSLLYIIKGDYHYKTQDYDFFAKSGDTVYLPQGSSYSYKILSSESTVMQVEYILEEKSNTETKSITFSEHPVRICENSNEIKLLFEELLLYFSTDKLKAISKVYDLICLCKNCILNKEHYSDDYKKIIPVIQYIESHITDKIYLNQLAEIANMSESHLRRIFSKNTGLSPIKYKNSVLIKCACNMLLYENMNVSATANALRFPDVYTFSQFFKKEKGISPKKYIALKKGTV